MGAINFDPTPWLTPDQTQGEPAKAANPAKVEPSGGARLATLAALAGELPAAVAMGLRRLASMPVPRSVKDAAVWGEIVADALRLRDDGWAAQALAMGWEPLHLFGVGEWFEGVAVELRGRPILALLADTRDAGGPHAAFVLDGGDGRRVGINRRDVPDGTKLLWEMR